VPSRLIQIKHSYFFLGFGDSCTKQTTYAVRNWLGQEGAVVTVVDTHGFGDSDLGNNFFISGLYFPIEIM
jgi:hypothetical protein